MSTLKEYLLTLAEPLVLLLISFFFLIYTFLSHPLLLLTTPSSFRSKWFERLYAYLGPRMAAAPAQVDYIESLISRAQGVVLELGPGGGDQMFHYKADKIGKIYAAEPNAHFHPGLTAKAIQAGLGGKFDSMNAGAQPQSLLPALQDAGLLPQDLSELPQRGIFDSIVTIKSMCCAPQSQLPETMATLQALLKPGGEFLFFEHLRNDSSFFTQCYAWLLNIFLWPALMGGCRLDGQLDKVVMGMSSWDKKEVENIWEYKGHEVFRYTKGICTKA